MRHRNGALAGACAAALALVLFVTPAAAVRFATPRLSGLSLDSGRIFFVQPDGTGTVLDLANGRVLERGAEARGMPLDPVSCGTEMVCPLAVGVLSLSSQDGLLELKSATGTLRAEYWQRSPLSGSRLWEAQGRLLIEDSSMSASALECIDLASLRPAWTYVYPSLGGFLSSFGTTKVEAALDAMSRMTQRSGNPAVVVQDPNPYGAEQVRRLLQGGWNLVILLFGAWIILTLRGIAASRLKHPARVRRLAWLGVLLATVAGFLACAAWLIDPALLWAAAFLFLIIWRTARALTDEGTGARRALGFVVAVSLVLGAGLPLISAFLIATMR